MSLWPLLACSLHGQASGVVRPAVGGGAQVDSVTGETWTLRLGADSHWISQLEGQSVWVSGRQLGQTIWVKDWRVVTGSDGSAPYLGLLRRHGANLVLEDWNSGGQYVFDEPSFRSLESGAGKVVLVRGFVVGPHTLRVVDWRALEGGEP